MHLVRDVMLWRDNWTFLSQPEEILDTLDPVYLSNFTITRHLYLDQGFGNLLAVLQHSDLRDDPVSLDPGQSLASIRPRAKDTRRPLFRRAPHLRDINLFLNQQDRSGSLLKYFPA